MNNNKGMANIKALLTCIALATSQGAVADKLMISSPASVSGTCPADPARRSPAGYASLPVVYPVGKSPSQWAVEHAVPLMIGNNTVNTVTGNISVSEGGKGAVVKGNNTSTAVDGHTVISGEEPAGLVVNGFSGQAVAGVNCQQDTTMGLNAYQWKEDSASDKGFMLNVSRSF